MMSYMTKVEVTDRDVKVLRKFAGGKTLKEVQDLKGSPGPRQLRRILKKLIEAGLLEDLSRGLRGSFSHRYMPVGDSFGTIRARTERTMKKEGDWREELSSIYTGALSAVTAITASNRSQKSSRIRELCTRDIKPVVRAIHRLRDSGFIGSFETGPLKKIVLPGEYFTGEYDCWLGNHVGWKRAKFRRGRKGTILVRHPSSTEEGDWFYPTLEERKDYLGFIAYELGKYDPDDLRRRLEEQRGSRPL